MTSGSDRDREAEAILAANDRGSFSLPTRGLYPFQWNWDSAFAALGYARLDPERGVRELETLAAAQWPDGMIPHIVFHTPDEGYFPGPEVWDTKTDPPTSGITQPPVLAIAAGKLAARGVLAGERLVRLLEAADRWHRWFLDARRDPATGAIGVVHPWESGRDNMPDWDAPLAAVPTEGVAPFERRDLGHVDAAMRPTQAQYERYIALVEFGRRAGWDQRTIMATSPFFVGDPGVAAILIAAEDALAGAAAAQGRDDLAQAARARRAELGEGLAALWNEPLGAHTTLNLRTGARGACVSSASFLAVGAPGVSVERHARIIAHFDRIAARCRYMVPSYDPDADTFEAQRYWRGPVWLVVNWLVFDRLLAAGEPERAERVRVSSRALAETAGFFEYYQPFDGAPLGGSHFTWSAAAWLDWARFGRAGAPAPPAGKGQS